MKTLVAAVILLGCFTAHAQSNCFGSGAFRTCSDTSGNTYNFQQFGNSTYMQGSNPATGSSWTQNSQTFGNTTMIQGQTNGRTWNETIQSNPGMTTYSGTDSQGRPFTKICTPAGCF